MTIHVMSYYAISAFINAITSVTLGWYVIRRNRQHQISRLFSYFAFSVAFWSSFYVLWQIDQSPERAIWWLRLLMAGAIWIPTFFLHFVTTLLDSENSPRLKAVIRGLYWASAIFTVSDCTPLFISTHVPRFGFPYWPVPGIFFHPFLAQFIGCVAYAHWLMYQQLRILSGVRRNQIRYVFLGTLVGFLGGATNFPLWYGIPVPPFGNALVTIYVGTIAYAIAKYRLMELNLALTIGSIFAAVYAVVLGIPFAIATLLQSQMMVWLGDRWWTAPLIMSTILASAGPIVYRRLRLRAEERLLREQRQYQATLLQASTGMTQIRDLKHLLQLIVHILTRTVHIHHAGIFLREEETSQYTLKACRDHHRFPQDTVLADTHPLIRWFGTHTEPLVTEEVRLHPTEAGQYLTSQELHTLLRWLEALQVAVIVPSFMADRLLGLVVVGPKRTGAIYTQDDLRVFTTLANQAALAIDNCLFYDKLKETQAQLTQADKMGSLGQLASGIAHEINNPATIISGESQLRQLELPKLKARFIDPTYNPTREEHETLLRQHAELVESNIKEIGRIKEIIRRVLRYAKKGKDGFGPVDLQQVLDDTLYLVKLQFGQVTTHVELPPDLPPVHGSVTQLQEVFMNLAINACHAMVEVQPPRPRNELTLRARTEDSCVLVEVTDTGVGIPATKLSKIFEAFYTTKAHGTGLGLFLVYGIIQNHQGTITVQSTEGQGTTFTVRLPIYRAPVTPAQQQITPA